MDKSVIDDPELLIRTYDIINESIAFHKCLVDKTTDAVVWNNIVFKKEGCIKVLEVMLSLEKSANKRKEIKADLDYWRTNYNSIKILFIKFVNNY